MRQWYGRNTSTKFSQFPFLILGVYLSVPFCLALSSKMVCVRIIYGNGFDAEECAAYAKVAVVNTMKHVATILRAMDKLDIPFVSPASTVRNNP